MPTAELVIARYQEDIAWTDGLPARLTAYNKGPSCAAHPDLHHLPNVGREAHSYLTHLVRRYDDLADWTVFCQGDPGPHLNGADVRGLLTPPDDPADPVLVPWHCTLKEWGDDGRLRWHEWPAWAGRYGTEIRPARLALADWLPAYVPECHAAPAALTYHPGAIFGVSARRIRSRPRAFYEGLLWQVADHPHPEEAHYLERCWPLVFAGPLLALAPPRPPQTAAAPYSIFVAVPHYSQLAPDALTGLMLCTDRHRFTIRTGGGSLLAMGFNSLWCAALNTRGEQGWTHFAMSHSDVEAPPGWLDTLLEEMDRVGADILSAVVAIKDARGLSSTGWQDPETGHITRLTMREVYKLPETFCAADVGRTRLMVNTGLFVARFDRPWVEEHCFRILDSIVRRDDGRFVSRTLPEDWNASGEWADKGLKVFATRKVAVEHHGGARYTNTRPWGEWDTDRGDGR